MEYREHIKKAIDYIEGNLCYELDLNACAKAAGYSMYHFLRVFKETVKMTPGDYIRKRRLSEIARKISQSDTFACDIAFSYGFNSKENFIRAFKAEHHVLPSEYRAAGNSLKLFNKFSLETTLLRVEPEILWLDELTMVAYKCDEEYVPNFWNKYNCKKLSKKLSGGVICADYGVSIRNNEENTKAYFCGISSEYAIGDREGTVEIKIPAGQYAVFTTPASTHFDFVNTIHMTWQYINFEWLPNCEYERRPAPEFETYIEDSRTFSEKIYIPISKKGGMRNENAEYQL